MPIFALFRSLWYKTEVIRKNTHKKNIIFFNRFWKYCRINFNLLRWSGFFFFFFISLFTISSIFLLLFFLQFDERNAFKEKPFRYFFIFFSAIKYVISFEMREKGKRKWLFDDVWTWHKSLHQLRRSNLLSTYLVYFFFHCVLCLCDVSETEMMATAGIAKSL